MPLFDYVCNRCKNRYEQFVDSRGAADPDAGKCPQCGAQESERLISRFAIGGQGDLRESTFHGCHENFDGVSHSHDHSRDHGSHEH